jgi:putative endonuclease
MLASQIVEELLHLIIKLDQHFVAKNPKTSTASTAPSGSPPVSITVGWIAENLVAQWLRQQGWHVLCHRWHCRWGELDLVVLSEAIAPSPVLAFVEVKARSYRNWDENGLLAITTRKQQKLWQAAQLFLLDHPAWVDCACRFDVALVTYKRSPQITRQQTTLSTAQLEIDFNPKTIKLGQAVAIGGDRFILHQYLTAAFEYEPI